jgi:hypothetical protein
VLQRHRGTERSRADAEVRPFARVPSKWTGFHYIEVLVTRGGRYDYAGVMWRLIAYSRSSAFVLTFNVSIIRYL